MLGWYQPKVNSSELNWDSSYMPTLGQTQERKTKASSTSNILTGRNNAPRYHPWGNLTSREKLGLIHLSLSNHVPMVSLLIVLWSAPGDVKKRGPGNEVGLSRLSIDVTLKHTHISVLPGFIMDVQQLFKSLKKEAECPLCLETVTNPKTLPCLHSFCLECLDKLANFARRQLQTTCLLYTSPSPRDA